MLANRVIHKIGPFTSSLLAEDLGMEEDWGTKEHWVRDFTKERSDDDFWLCGEEMTKLFPIVKNLKSFTIQFWQSETPESLLVTGSIVMNSLTFVIEGEITHLEVNPEWTLHVPLSYPWHVTLEPLSYVNQPSES